MHAFLQDGTSTTWMFYDEYENASEEEIQDRINRKAPPAIKPGMYGEKVCCFDLNGNHLQTFDSFYYGSKGTGVNRNHISTACAEKREGKNYAGGYLWRKYRDCTVTEGIVNPISPYNKYQETKKLYRFDLNFNYMQWFYNSTHAGDALNVPPESIQKRANLNTNMQNYIYCDSFWLYEENVIIDDGLIRPKEIFKQWIDSIEYLNNEEIYQFDSNEKFVRKYASRQAATEETGYSKSTLLGALRNEDEKYHLCMAFGYYWRRRKDVEFIDGVPHMKWKIIPKDERDDYVNPATVPLYRFDFRNELIKYYPLGMAQVNREEGRNASVNAYFTGRYKTVLNSLWGKEGDVYTDENGNIRLKNFDSSLISYSTTIHMFSLDKKYIKSFNDTKECADSDENFVRRRIQECLSQPKKTHQNYYFRRDKDVIKIDNVFFIKDNYEKEGENEK